MSNKYNFFAELSRRNVYKVAITYGVIAWLFFEILAVLLPPDAASSVLNVFLILATLGFILALYISWSFEATPEGLKRTEKVPPGANFTNRASCRKYATFVIGTASLALALTAWHLVRPKTPPPSETHEPYSARRHRRRLSVVAAAVTGGRREIQGPAAEDGGQLQSPSPRPTLSS